MAKIVKFDSTKMVDDVQWDDYLGYTQSRVAKWKYEDEYGYLDLDRMTFHEKIEFEENYKIIAGGLSFGMALDIVKENGLYLSRTAWDESGEYITMIAPPDYKTIAGEKIGLASYIAIKTKNNTLMPYTPTQSDMLTNDWKILKENE